MILDKMRSVVSSHRDIVYGIGQSTWGADKLRFYF